MTAPDPAALLSRILLVAGIAIAAAGLLLMLGPRLPLLGRLPGDIVWSRSGVRVYLPITTCLLISLVLTILMALLSRFRR